MPGCKGGRSSGHGGHKLRTQQQTITVTQAEGPLQTRGGGGAGNSGPGGDDGENWKWAIRVGTQYRFICLSLLQCFG